MQLSLFALGVTLLTAGVAFIYWPAALICLGLILALVALLGFEYPYTPPALVKQSVSTSH